MFSLKRHRFSSWLLFGHLPGNLSHSKKARSVRSQLNLTFQNEIFIPSEENRGMPTWQVLALNPQNFHPIPSTYKIVLFPSSFLLTTAAPSLCNCYFVGLTLSEIRTTLTFKSTMAASSTLYKKGRQFCYLAFIHKPPFHQRWKASRPKAGRVKMS